MSYFVGLDVSLRTVALWVVDDDRDIVLERMLDCEVEAIDVCLRKFGKPITKLGFEAGVMSQMLFTNAQKLLSVHGQIYNLFNFRRHLISRNTLRKFWQQAQAEWNIAAASAFA